MAAAWHPLNPNAFVPLVQQLQQLEAQENIFNPPANAWAPTRRQALREGTSQSDMDLISFSAITYLLTCTNHSALGLDGGDRSDQVTNIIIAIANACIDEHFAEFTTADLVARGWIVPVGNAWQRVINLEDSLQVLQEVVQTNHEQVTGQLQDLSTKMNQVLAHFGQTPP
jgi:hypothetical protein